MKVLAAFLLLFVYLKCQSQIVETAASHPTIVDGLHMDENGIVYTTPGGLMGGTGIGVYNSETAAYTPNFATGIYGGIDVDQFNDSMLAVTAYDNNSLYQVNKVSGEVSLLATNFDGPSGIAVDNDNNIYVANYGSPPSYNGNTIHKVMPNGDSWVYVESPLLYQPQAMEFNSEGELVIYSLNKLFKVSSEDSTLVEWVPIPNKLNNMVYREMDNSFYATSIQAHLVHKITDEGEVSIFAGSSMGYVDGSTNEALFSRPLGIAIHPNGNEFYISESGTGRLRHILLNEFLFTEKNDRIDLKVYPNPAENLIKIDCSVVIDKWRIFDGSGKLILNDTSNSNSFEIPIGSLTPGHHYIEFHTENDFTRMSFMKIE